MEDPLTGDVTHRTLQEEDEDHAVASGLPAQYQLPPTIQLQLDAPVDAVLFLLGTAPGLLVSSLLGAPPPLGSIAVPELQRLKSPLEEELGLTHGHRTHTASVRRMSSGLLVVDAARPLPVEQAAAWTTAVLGALPPARLVVVDTLPAMRYCGPGSPADEDLVFGLSSTAARTGSSGSSALLPALPPGTMLDGLAAALLTAAEARGLPGVAVVGVQMGPAPDAQFAASLAAGAAAALESVGAPAPWSPRPQSALVSAIAEAADNLHRGSAGASIFV